MAGCAFAHNCLSYECNANTIQQLCIAPTNDAFVYTKGFNTEATDAMLLMDVCLITVYRLDSYVFILEVMPEPKCVQCNSFVAAMER